jgi:hypothetical protein
MNKSQNKDKTKRSNAAMVALDKISLRVSIPVRLYVKLQRMQRAAGIQSLSVLINALLSDAAAGVELSAAELLEIQTIIIENAAKRERYLNNLKAKESAKKGPGNEW